MNWLICIVLGHDWKYKCDMDHGTLRNYRTCKTCHRVQCGTFIHDNIDATWKDCDHDTNR